MPHAGLIPSSLRKDEALLLRARLHLRGGRIRFSRGNTIDAIAAFYDAFISAMLRFAESASLRHTLSISKSDDLADDLSLFRVIKRSKILSIRFSESDFHFFLSLLGSAMDGIAPSFDEDAFFEKFCELLTAYFSG